MPEIAELVIQKQHDLDPRERKKCAGCDRRRLCTRHTLSFLNGDGTTWDEWFCNECMTATPPWR
jgi:hypothetical protein